METIEVEGYSDYGNGVKIVSLLSTGQDALDSTSLCIPIKYFVEYQEYNLRSLEILAEKQ